VWGRKEARKGRWIEGAGAAVEGEGPSERRANFYSPFYPYRNERPDVYWYRAVPIPAGTLCWTAKMLYI
jgi:hypothetical protein